MNILKSAFTAGLVGWLYGGLPAFVSARKAFIESSHGEMFQNRADAVVRPGERPAREAAALGGAARGRCPWRGDTGAARGRVACGTRVFAPFWHKKFAVCV